MVIASVAGQQSRTFRKGTYLANDKSPNALDYRQMNFTIESDCVFSGPNTLNLTAPCTLSWDDIGANAGETFRVDMEASYTLLCNENDVFNEEVPYGDIFTILRRTVKAPSGKGLSQTDFKRINYFRPESQSPMSLVQNTGESTFMLVVQLWRPSWFEGISSDEDKLYRYIRYSICYGSNGMCSASGILAILWTNKVAISDITCIQPTASSTFGRHMCFENYGCSSSSSCVLSSVEWQKGVADHSVDWGSLEPFEWGNTFCLCDNPEYFYKYQCKASSAPSSGTSSQGISGTMIGIIVGASLAGVIVLGLVGWMVARWVRKQSAKRVERDMLNYSLEEDVSKRCSKDSYNGKVGKLPFLQSQKIGDMNELEVYENVNVCKRIMYGMGGTPLQGHNSAHATLDSYVCRKESISISNSHNESPVASTTCAYADNYINCDNMKKEGGDSNAVCTTIIVSSSSSVNDCSCEKD
eukprot:Nk52_evm11s277 gene=Nk52_evmTU11s277